MYQNILKIKTGRLFKGYTGSMQYVNNSDIHITQSYYATTVIDKISTKGEPFTKVIYQQSKLPKYISNAIKNVYPGTIDTSYSFKINMFYEQTIIDASFIINPLYGQCELHYNLASNKHVEFGNHYDNIELSKKASFAMSKFKSLFKNQDIVNYIKEAVENEKTTNSNSLFIKNKFGINLVYLLEHFSLNIDDFIIKKSLKPF